MIRRDPFKSPKSRTSSLELEGSGVDAVSQPRRLRTVFEHMTQVGTAVGALDLGPSAEQAVILLFLQALFRDRRPETRPAGSRIEFCIGGKDLLLADYANINARCVVVP